MASATGRGAEILESLRYIAVDSGFIFRVFAPPQVRRWCRLASHRLKEQKKRSVAFLNSHCHIQTIQGHLAIRQMTGHPAVTEASQKSFVLLLSSVSELKCFFSFF